MGIYLHMTGDTETSTDFEKWVHLLDEYHAHFYHLVGFFSVVEWSVNPAFGGQIICEGESPEGYLFRFSVDHDELAKEYNRQTGKDSDFVF